MLYREAIKRLLNDRLVVVCMVVIVIFLILGGIAKFASDADKQFKDKDPVTKIARHFHPPTPLIALGLIETMSDNRKITDEQKKQFEGGLFSKAAWRLPLGADRDGRSVLGMVLYGIFYAFIIGALTTIVSILVAVPMGAVAGYFGGWVDDIIVWFYTTLASMPFILLLISIIASLPKDIRNNKAWGLYAVLFVIGVTTWVGLARLIRAEFMKHKVREYVQAARALGFSSARIAFSHILPNVSHIIIITFTLSFVASVNIEVFLNFIGVGIPPTTPTFGQMIANGKTELTRDPSVWWPLTTATSFLFVLSLAFSIFGDALRDALDPKLRAS